MKRQFLKRVIFFSISLRRLYNTKLLLDLLLHMEALYKVRPTLISRIILVYYCKCCNLMPLYSLSIPREIASGKTIIFLAHFFKENGFQLAFFNDFVQYFMLISDSTKTIRLLALDFHELIVDSGFALKLSPHRNLELVI